MAQSDQQGVGASGQGAAGSQTAQGDSTRTEQGRGETGSQAGATGRESTQSAPRLARRETWEDPLSTFFGGSPFALFRRLSDDMDRLFFGGQGLAGLGAFGGRFLPNIDVDQREDRLLIRADLPGLRPEDFQVNIEDEALVLQGERRNESEESRGGVRRFERSYGNFRRVIPLPPGANVDAAQARFENGVLEIEIPVQPQQSRTRRLEVQSGAPSGSISEPTRH